MRKKITSPFWALAMVAALGMGLAGCGSSGSDDTAEAPMTMPEPMPAPEPMPEPEPEPVAVSVTDFNYLSGDNVPMAGTLEIAAGTMETSGGVTYLCAEGGDACTVTIAEDGSAEATGGTVTASLTATAMAQVEETKEMKAEEIAAMELAHRNRIIGQHRAIDAALPVSTTDTPATLEEAEISVTRAAGASARIRVASAGPDGYSPSDDGAMANGDWAGERLVRSLRSSQEHLVVYTDIGPPTRIQFYDFDSRASTPSLYDNEALNPAGATAVDVSGADGLQTPLPIGAPTGGDATRVPMTRAVLDSARFESPGPEGSGVKIQRFIGSATGGAGGPGLSFPGNFNGASGRYTCTNTGSTTGDCVVTIPETGPYVATAGVWTFTPDENATAWLNDREFMHFGWWLREPNSANGAYSFQYYAAGTAYANTTTAPSGSATYTGRAAGMYAVQTIEDGGVTDGMAGEFTAAATLTANFDAQNNAGAPAPTIQGTINGFQSSEGHDVSGWEVTLHRNSIDTTAPGLAAPNIVANSQPNSARPGYTGVTATMGDQTAQGAWTAQFFGNARAPDATGTVVDTDGAQPLGVGGTFNASNEAASIAGAFGARR